MFESKEELVSDLAGAGLGSYAERIGDLAQPCLHFAPLAGLEEADKSAVRLGGFPELKPGIEWPRRPALPHADEFRAWLKRDGLAKVWATPRPLTLIARIRLAEAAACYPGPWPLPSHGHLNLYWESLCGCYGQGVLNARAVWEPEPSGLKPLTATPQDYPADVAGLPPVMPRRHFGLKLGWSCPDQATTKWLISDAELRELMHAKPFQDLYWRKIHAFSFEDGPYVHRMLGWSAPIQDDPAVQAASEAAGVEDVPVRWGTHETITPLLPTTKDWLLLLQVGLAEAYQDTGVEGMVYFMIPRADAEAGRFDRVSAVYQQT
jgi:hypothetical protein